MIHPLISIVTVVFNDVLNIEKTIQSVVEQTYRNIEYIIIDGGSSDGTVEIIKKYQDKIHFWISEPDRGIYDAMNKAIDAARGEWINFMNSGDYFKSPDVVTFFSNTTFNADIVFGDALIQYPDFQVIWNKLQLSEMWKRMPFCHQASFSRTSLMKNQKFDTRYRLSSDFKFIYHCYLQGVKFQYIDHVICMFDFKVGASIRSQSASLKERKEIVLAESPSLKKWFYYLYLTFYLKFAVFIKRIIGKKFTAWLTNLLRK